MQIVVPMSGFGSRFTAAGYQLPKPLIDVDGLPMIAHVVRMFPGDHDFIFICNQEHLANPDLHMAATLRAYAPGCKIIAVSEHNLGPVQAVLMAEDALDSDKQTIVNYCDFCCYWDFSDFSAFVEAADCDGCVPAYRGFHPHSLGSTYYAYIREEGGWINEIKEKSPFTEDPMNEYASSGTYYFRSGRLCLELFKLQVLRGMLTNGEFYASLAYNLFAERGLRAAVYELQHFMQWGTPEDLHEYLTWSKVFRRLIADNGAQARHRGAVLLPMAGLGQRFSDANYTTTKPLITVSGRPMVIQAMRDLPDAPVKKFVMRRDISQIEDITVKLRSTFIGSQFELLEHPTDGQAITCQIGAKGLNESEPVTIGSCDNGIIYDVDRFARILENPEDLDVVVWTVRGHPDAIRRPEQFGWVEVDTAGLIQEVIVKGRPSDPRTTPMITGTFTFRKLAYFHQAAAMLVSRDGRVRGEFYVDSLIEDCLNLGLKVGVFEVECYVGWGTPNDLRTFEYWQSCFHKWDGHPYRLEKDSRVPAAAISTLESRYARWPQRDAPRALECFDHERSNSGPGRLLRIFGR